jgi:hypothetical protein
MPEYVLKPDPVERDTWRQVPTHPLTPALAIRQVEVLEIRNITLGKRPATGRHYDR